MFTAKKVYAMLENESLWEAATQCLQILAAAKIPHAVMGGVAVCLHGYQRNTVDVDLLVRKDDQEAALKSLQGEKFHVGQTFLSAGTREGRFGRQECLPHIQFLLADDDAGKSSEVKFPDPADERSTTEIEYLPVLRLSKLIESKIACGLGNVRRTHKDFADVVELIIHNRLNSSFARLLHKSLRTTYRELVRRSRG
jgi:hypothetical protein